MTPELKAKWVAALRSGEYHQTTGRMVRYEPGGVSNCCLGVLRHVVTGSHGLPTDWTGNLGGSSMPVSSERVEWGLDLAAAQTLAGMNDGGHSFEEIASYIERHDL